MQPKWKVSLVGQAKKSHKNLPVMVKATLEILMEQIKLTGAIRGDWPNFGKLSNNCFHCHLKKGKPTYVACWQEFKKSKEIKVYYAGTHEKAPY